ncbi:MAG: hypothetical protein WDN28_25380 [Chthoniobacter sp.]
MVPYVWDVTSFTQTKLAGDKLESLVLKAVTENSSSTTTYAFNSRSYNAGDTPYLKVTTQSAGAPPPTVSQVQFYYRYSTDDITWTPWTSFQTVNATPWTATFNYGNGYGYYEFYSVATDTNGSLEPAPAFADATVHFTPGTITNQSTNVTANGATAQGAYNPYGVDTTVYFDYGTTGSYGSSTALAGYRQRLLQREFQRRSGRSGPRNALSPAGCHRAGRRHDLWRGSNLHHCRASPHHACRGLDCVGRDSVGRFRAGAFPAAPCIGDSGVMERVVAFGWPTPEPSLYHSISMKARRRIPKAAAASPARRSARLRSWISSQRVVLLFATKFVVLLAALHVASLAPWFARCLPFYLHAVACGSEWIGAPGRRDQRSRGFDAAIHGLWRDGRSGLFGARVLSVYRRDHPGFPRQLARPSSRHRPSHLLVRLAQYLARREFVARGYSYALSLRFGARGALGGALDPFRDAVCGGVDSLAGR